MQDPGIDEVAASLLEKRLSVLAFSWKRE